MPRLPDITTSLNASPSRPNRIAGAGNATQRNSCLPELFKPPEKMHATETTANVSHDLSPVNRRNVLASLRRRSGNPVSEIPAMFRVDVLIFAKPRLYWKPLTFIRFITFTRNFVLTPCAGIHSRVFPFARDSRTVQCVVISALPISCDTRTSRAAPRRRK